MKDWNTVLRLLDFFLALASLGYGLMVHSALWSVAGMVGLLLVWVNVPARLQRWLFSRHVRRIHPGPSRTENTPPKT